MGYYPRLRDLREDSDLSIRKLAELLNMQRTTYHNYETGKREVPFDLIITLAKFYNVSIDYLVGRDNEKNPTKNYGEKKKLLKISESLTDKNFDKLIVYATALLDGQKQ